MINSWFSFPPPSLNRHLRYDTQRFENGRLRKPPLLEISFGTRGSIISMLTHKKFCGSTCIQLSFSNFLKIQFSSGRKQFVEAPHANLAWSVIVNHGDGICRISSSPSATYHIFSLIKSIPKLSLYFSFLDLEVSHSYNLYSHHSVFSSIALFHLTQIWTPRSNYYHFYKRSQQSHTFQKRRKTSNSRALGCVHVWKGSILDEK